MKKLNDKFDLFKKSIEQLKEALEAPIVTNRDKAGVIQTFEFSYEMSWKLLKAYLEFEGITEPQSARSVFKESFKANVIDDESIWLEMINDRNKTSHTYQEETANKVLKNITDSYYALFKKLKNDIASKI